MSNCSGTVPYNNGLGILVRDGQTRSRWISRAAEIADLIGLRLIGGAHPPGFEGDSVSIAIWPGALVPVPVAAPAPAHRGDPLALFGGARYGRPSDGLPAQSLGAFS
jgi:hypothetical protein